MWLATWSLPLTELQQAIMIEADHSALNDEIGVFEATQILDICGSLVDTYKIRLHRGDIVYVRLSHFTVKVCLGHLRPLIY